MLLANQNREIFWMNNSSRSEARSAERSEFIISSRAKARAVCEPRVGPSELQSWSFHLYLHISDGVRHDVIQWLTSRRIFVSTQHSTERRARAVLFSLRFFSFLFFFFFFFFSFSFHFRYNSFVMFLYIAHNFWLTNFLLRFTCRSPQVLREVLRFTYF